MMIGYDGHRGTINYLAISPKYQRSGYGVLIMERVEAFLIGIGCPKVNLCVRKENITVLDFYADIGYRVDDVHVLGKRLMSDD